MEDFSDVGFSAAAQLYQEKFGNKQAEAPPIPDSTPSFGMEAAGNLSPGASPNPNSTPAYALVSEGGPTDPKRPTWDKSYKDYSFIFTSISTNTVVNLVLNPESLVQTEPARISVTQTKGGMFVDSFGVGIKTIVIAGNTGYQAKKGPEVGTPAGSLSGANQFFELRKMYRNWLKASSDPNEYALLKFYNWADSEAYEVVITQFTLNRAVGRPLLYQYNIQMTCIEDLMQSQPTPADPVTDALSTGILGKVIAALNSINNAIMTVDSYVVKGMTFFSTLSQSYVAAQTVVDSVNNLSNDISMFVAGVTNFITTPFDLVAQTITSIGDFASSLCSLSVVPGAVVRSLRDIACALKSLPLSIFSGFTNPYLFEGASNCGTTLGIPTAPVANTDNSFSATAQLPPQVTSSQAFDTVVSPLTLNDQPLNVTGVYLATDIEQTGLNYLASWSGRSVYLTSVPSVPVIVYYTTQQPTTQNLITYASSNPYIVLMGDSLQRIALKIYGDPTRWKEIALYNNLEYPYITDDLDFVKNIAATGPVRFYRGSGTTAVPIPKGTLVYVPYYQGTDQINFYTMIDATLPLAANYIDVPVQAEVEGDIGNVWGGLITGYDTSVFDSTKISRVSNISAITGGKIWNIAIVGDAIQIPQTTRTAISAVVPSTEGYTALFGIDIWLNDGEFDTSVDQSVDFARVFGVDNLVQALEDRLVTQSGYYPYHSTYGSGIPFYIGKPGLPHQYDLIKTEAMNTALLDPRISSISSFLLQITGDVVSVSFNAIPIGQQNFIPLTVVI
jgi:hypothetical protein